jgi:hypothetical protein
MLINSLDVMEQIVDNNAALSWDGWTVVESKSSATAWMKPEGALVNGTWVLQKRFEPSSDGWDVPNKLAGNNGSHR